MAKQIIHSGKIEIQGSGKGGVEGDRLKFDHNIATQFEMIEKQVESKILIAHFEKDLSADESKSAAELKQEMLNMVDKRLLNVVLFPGIRCTQKIKQIRVFEYLHRHVGILRWKCKRKVIGGFTLSLMKAAIKLYCKDITTPTIFHGFLDIPEPLTQRFKLLQNANVVPPRNL